MLFNLDVDEGISPIERQIVTSLILSPVVNEFGFEGPWLKLGQNIGLLVGAAFWGVACDVWGRQ